MKNGRLQAKDIPDSYILSIIQGLNFSCVLSHGPEWGERLFTNDSGRGARLAEILDLTPYPEKLMRVKLDSMVRRKLLRHRYGPLKYWVRADHKSYNDTL
ncbi:DNA binding protein [Microbacterium phage Count]|nr:DNA binding protein [Microbacterium phage Count]